MESPLNLTKTQTKILKINFIISCLFAIISFFIPFLNVYKYNSNSYNLFGILQVLFSESFGFFYAGIIIFIIILSLISLGFSVVGLVVALVPDPKKENKAIFVDNTAPLSFFKYSTLTYFIFTMFFIVGDLADPTSYQLVTNLTLIYGALSIVSLLFPLITFFITRSYKTNKPIRTYHFVMFCICLCIFFGMLFGEQILVNLYAFGINTPLESFEYIMVGTDPTKSFLVLQDGIFKLNSELSEIIKLDGALIPFFCTIVPLGISMGIIYKTMIDSFDYATTIYNEEDAILFDKNFAKMYGLGATKGVLLIVFGASLIFPLIYKFPVDATGSLSVTCTLLTPILMIGAGIYSLVKTHALKEKIRNNSNNSKVDSNKPTETASIETKE